MYCGWLLLLVSLPLGLYEVILLDNSPFPVEVHAVQAIRRMEQLLGSNSRNL